jgi:TatD DNase family protein
VAIGEIGLDYYWDKTYKAEQQELLRLQLQLARELDLPVMIHNREATEDTMRILMDAQGEGGLRGVVHCFNGSKETAQQILAMGMYIGIGGVLTFKNCKLHETLEVVPLERIVLETDGPYLAPVPFRGQRNESRLMIHVAERLAQIYQTSVQHIIARTSANAKKLFNI